MTSTAAPSTRIGPVVYSVSNRRPALAQEITVENSTTRRRVVMAADDVRLTINREQAEKLAEILALHVDPDVVRLDNDDPDGAAFVQSLISALTPDPAMTLRPEHT